MITTATAQKNHTQGTFQPVTLEDWCRKFDRPFRKIAAACPSNKRFKSLPGQDIPYTFQMEQPDVFCGNVVDGWILPERGVVCTADGALIYQELTIFDQPIGIGWEAYFRGIGPDGLVRIEFDRGTASKIEPTGIFVGCANNFGHFVIECLLRIAALNWMPELQALPIIVYDDLPPNFCGFLDLLGYDVSRRITVPRHKPIRFEKIWMLSAPMSRAENRPPVRIWADAIWALRTSFGYLCNPMTHSRPRLFIGRGLATTRRIVNQSVVDETVGRYGAVGIDLHTYSPEKQIAEISNAEMIVAVQGASSQILMFAPTDCAVIQIGPPKFAGDFGPPAIAAILQQPFAHLVGREPTDDEFTNAGLHQDPSRKPIDRDFFVDPAALERLLSGADAWCKRVLA